MTENTLINTLVEIAGEKNVLSNPAELEGYEIDDVVPRSAVFPKTADQISEIMKFATADGLSVIPWGMGTKQSIGEMPERADIIVGTKNLSKIIEHEANDLIATAQAGASLKKFQTRLKKQNQFLPLDIIDKASIGGIVATNDSGPMRLRYGTVRELMIGLKVVRADGSVFKGGSKVVKNVAGYDLPKLFTGSFGSLGIITEATFRLYPIPEYSETYIIHFSSPEKAHETVMSLLNSQLVLVALEVLNPGLVNTVDSKTNLGLDTGSHVLVIRIMNVKKAVKDQTRAIQKITKDRDRSRIVVDGRNEEKLWHEISEFSHDNPGINHIVCKAGVPINDVPKVFSELSRLENEQGVNITASARAGNGIFNILFDGEDSLLVEILKELRAFCLSMNGYLTLQSAPAVMKSKISVWGDIGPAVNLMKRIKHNFDPDNLLNPGRFL